MKAIILKTGALLILVLGLQGCILVHEDDNNRREDGFTQRGTTIGEELADLAQAHENGLLSDREYERLRQRILDL